jgi:hypothetical protein
MKDDNMDKAGRTNATENNYIQHSVAKEAIWEA